MPEDDIKCESFTVTFIDSLLVYDNKYYPQVYLENFASEIVNKKMTDYLDGNFFEDQILQMLYYDRIDITKRINLSRSSKSKECMICHYFFFDHGFKFQDYVCNGCHDLTMLRVNISNIAIITVKNVYCCCIIDNISKSEVIHLLKFNS